MKCKCIEDYHIEFNEVVFRKGKIYDYFIGSDNKYTIKLDSGDWSILTSKNAFDMNFVDLIKERRDKLKKLKK